MSKLVTYYVKNIRAHDESDMVGIRRQILLMMKKGVTMDDISQAMQNYAADEFTKNSHEAHRHHIRKFMMPEKIRQWKVPPVRKTFGQIERAKDASLMALDRLEQQAPPPVVVEAKTRILYEDPEETDSF